MVTVRRILPWLSAALIVTGLAGAAFLVAHEVSNPAATDTGERARAVPTRAEAEALLADAYRLAQTPNHTGLCQTIAQNPEACRKILEWAYEAHAMPSADVPAVVDVSTVPTTEDSQGAVVLRIQGIRVDGSPYTSDFSAVRTASGEIRSQNAVYWYSDFVPPSP